MRSTIEVSEEQLRAQSDSAHARVVSRDMVPKDYRRGGGIRTPSRATQNRIRDVDEIWTRSIGRRDLMRIAGICCVGLQKRSEESPPSLSGFGVNCSGRTRLDRPSRCEPLRLDERHRRGDPKLIGIAKKDVVSWSRGFSARTKLKTKVTFLPARDFANVDARSDFWQEYS